MIIDTCDPVLLMRALCLLGMCVAASAASGETMRDNGEAGICPHSQLVKNLNAGRPQTIVALGTSITENGAWVDHLADALEANYPSLANVLNSGASGKNSNYGIEHFDRLVIQKKPDTLFVEYSINDCVERFDISVAKARENLETIIDTTLKHFPECEIILMTMTPGNKYEPGHKSYRKAIAAHYTMYRAVARERGFLLIDHYPNWCALQQNDPTLFKKYVPDTIHPRAEGNAAVVSPVIIKALGLPNKGGAAADE